MAAMADFVHDKPATPEQVSSLKRTRFTPGPSVDLTSLDEVGGGSAFAADPGTVELEKALSAVIKTAKVENTVVIIGPEADPFAAIAAEMFGPELVRAKQASEGAGRDHKSPQSQRSDRTVSKPPPPAPSTWGGTVASPCFVPRFGSWKSYPKQGSPATVFWWLAAAISMFLFFNT